MDDFPEIQDEETKKVAALQEIAHIVTELDSTLEELKGSENKLKSWYEQKKAVYEIKKILHTATHYEHFNQEEYTTFLAEYKSFIAPTGK
ncbi:hypothetical protein ACWOFR_02895 [Carnobacterium gallinarum]|uniref:hypothetical protein n=1 Tax=Carnobacterium gallinarum TaxID=2749 RepID=UPI0005515D19|nr:hypothetical protein [Carnobacterium gallinarum]